MCLVDIPTGRVSLVETDFNLGGLCSPSQIRTYRSTNIWAGDLGHGWGHSFGMQLFAGDGGQSLTYRDIEGRRSTFAIPKAGHPVQNSVEQLAMNLLSHEQIVWPGLARDAQKGVFALSLANGWGLLFDVRASSGHFPLRGLADASGNFIHVAPDQNSLPTRIDFPEARSLNLVRDNQGRLIEIRLTTTRSDAGPGGRASTSSESLVGYGYDSAGNLATVIDRGGTRTYQYDRAHRLTSHRDRVGADCKTEYDASGRCSRMFLPGQSQPREYQYDTEHRTTRVKNATGAVSRFAYAESERVIEAVDSAGFVSKYLYDSSQRLIQAIDQAGGETTVIYNAAGRQMGIEGPDGNVTGFKRDDRGRVIQVVSPSGQVTSFARDAKGRAIGLTSPGGGVCKVAYDSAGRLGSVVTPFGKSVSLEWSGDGRVLTEKDEKGIRTQQSFDQLGNLAAIEDAAGAVTRYGYDSAGRLHEVTNPDGTASRLVYDAEGHLAEYHDEAGNVTRWTYDLAGRRIATITPAGRTIQFEYDDENRLIAIEEPGGLTHRLQYDARGLMVEQTFSDGRLERYEHDPRGLPIQIQDPAGEAMIATRDPAGRITHVAYPDGQTRSITYDGAGRAMRVEGGGAVLEQEWGDAPRPIRETLDRREFKRTFGAAGELLSVADESGVKAAYNYDDEGGVVEVLLTIDSSTTSTTQPQSLAQVEPAPMPRVHQFQHDRRGLMTRWEMPGGKIETRTYDLRRQLIEQIVRLENKILVQRRYTYEPTGRVSAIMDSRRGRRDFKYDAEGRLLSVQTPSGAQKFPWDNSGDLIAGGFQYARGHRLTTAGQFQLEHDARGFVVRRRAAGVADEFTYTAQGLLSSVRRGDGKRASYKYDPVGRLWLRDDGSVQTHYRWNGEVPWSVESSTERTWYLHLPRERSPIEQITDGKGYSLHVDHQGVVHELIDDQGNIAWERTDGVWSVKGNAQRGKPSLCILGFPGQLRDSFSGLFYNRYRYCYAEVAHYMTPDPIGLWGGLDAYRYVPDPINNIDPDGLSCRGKNDDSTLYRGDKRPPSEICGKGFAPRNPLAGLTVAQHVEGVPSSGSNWVSTTYDGDVANGFSDEHIYVIANPGCGVEVDCDPDVQAKYGDPADSEKEIAFNKPIPPSNVVGFWTKAGGPSSFQGCP